jgi:hypothetical protein
VASTQKKLHASSLPPSSPAKGDATREIESERGGKGEGNNLHCRDTGLTDFGASALRLRCCSWMEIGREEAPDVPSSDASTSNRTDSNKHLIVAPVIVSSCVLDGADEHDWARIVCGSCLGLASLKQVRALLWTRQRKAIKQPLLTRNVLVFNT